MLNLKQLNLRLFNQTHFLGRNLNSCGFFGEFLLHPSISCCMGSFMRFCHGNKTLKKQPVSNSRIFCCSKLKTLKSISSSLYGVIHLLMLRFYTNPDYFNDRKTVHSSCILHKGSSKYNSKVFLV